MDADAARRLALSLPGAAEHDHHGRPSFRVEGKIFATLWTSEALNIMAPEEVIVAAADDSPEACSRFYWGKRLRAVQVVLRKADPERVEALLHAAWSTRAPNR